MLDNYKYRLAYMTECTLATVESLAMRKTPPKAELERQQCIALHGLLAFFHKNESLEQYAFRKMPRLKEILSGTKSEEDVLRNLDKMMEDAKKIRRN